tara:strand:- start:17 stop:532 length:516 start_codon:yes stop_codon:yes gene_type:complete
MAQDKGKYGRKLHISVTDDGNIVIGKITTLRRGDIAIVSILLKQVISDIEAFIGYATKRMFCVNAGMINNIPAEFAVGGSAIYESYNSFNKALSHLNSYNKSTGEGKRPEDIYNNSKLKLKEDVDQLWPTYSKIGCAIVCGILEFGIGAARGYIYQKEILNAKNATKFTSK